MGKWLLKVYLRSPPRIRQKTTKQLDGAASTTQRSAQQAGTELQYLGERKPELRPNSASGCEIIVLDDDRVDSKNTGCSKEMQYHGERKPELRPNSASGCEIIVLDDDSDDSNNTGCSKAKVPGDSDCDFLYCSEGLGDSDCSNPDVSETEVQGNDDLNVREDESGSSELEAVDAQPKEEDVSICWDPPQLHSM